MIVRVRVGSRLCMLVTRVRLRLQKLFRVFFEFRQTVLAAEIIGLSVVDVASRCAIGLNVHAANWIDHVLSLP